MGTELINQDLYYCDEDGNFKKLMTATEWTVTNSPNAPGEVIDIRGVMPLRENEKEENCTLLDHGWFGDHNNNMVRVEIFYFRNNFRGYRYKVKYIHIPQGYGRGNKNKITRTSFYYNHPDPDLIINDVRRCFEIDISEHAKAIKMMTDNAYDKEKETIKMEMNSVYGTTGILTTTDGYKGYFDSSKALKLWEKAIGIKHDELEYPQVPTAKEEYRARTRLPEIKKVIFNRPATIVEWADGTKTVVKVQGREKYDKEKGLAMCIAKKAMGNSSYYGTIMNKWLEVEE